MENKLILDYLNRKTQDYYFNYQNLLIGGGKTYTVNLGKIYDKEIKFEEIYNKDERQIILNTEENFNKGKKYNSCVVITIKENEKTAELSSLNIAEGKCINLDEFGLKTTGTFHLKVAIKMLKKYQEKFKIKKIILEDIATIKCQDEEFPLSTYLLLTRGYTFYGKEGFSYQKTKLNDLLKSYQKYVNKLKVKDVNLIQLLQPSKNKELNNKILQMAKDNGELRFIDLLKNIFSYENMLNEEICQLYFKLHDRLILYLNKLDENYLGIFMNNLKMELRL